MYKAMCLTLMFFCLFSFSTQAEEKKERQMPSRLLTPQLKPALDRETVDELTILKQKVETLRRLFNYVDGAFQSGSSGGTALRQAEARAELASAEAALYRYDGNRSKWLEALETQVEARTHQLCAISAGFEAGTADFDALCQVELKLLDAQMELKKAMDTPKRPWGPEQATGKPDTYLLPKGGDYRSAWASRTPDGQKEWLELTWKTSIEAVGVDVYETFNPGALEKVVTFDEEDKEVILWEGVDPTPGDAIDGKGISQIRFEKPTMIRKIRLYLDSPNIPGWNEIDAVGLIDSSEAVHWASDATASSSYTGNFGVAR